MAIAKAGAPIGQISGRLAGAEFAIQGATQIIKQAKRTRNHTTPKESNQQADFMNAAAVWHGLSTDIKTQWETAAKLFTSKNRLGTPKYLSGFQLWRTWYPFHYFPITGTYRYTPPDQSLRCETTGPVTVSFSNTLSQYYITTTNLAPPHPYGARQIWIHRFSRSTYRHPVHWTYLTTITSQSATFNLWALFAGRGDYLLQGELVWLRVRNIGMARWPGGFNAACATVVGAPP